MSFDPSNTIWVVTGANRGIGLGLVKLLLARPSTTVIATVRNDEAAATLNSEITSTISPGKDSSLHNIILDFSTALDPEFIQAAFKSALPTLTRIDILINNAAISPPPTLTHTISASSLRAAFETNTIAPLLTFQALWPLLKASPSAKNEGPGPGPGPKLITITSELSAMKNMVPVPAGAYGPSKAAANWLTKSLHEQHAEDGLIAIALHPGWVQTRMGKTAARAWGFPEGEGPPTTVEGCVEGMLKVVDNATREGSSGRFLTFEGGELEW